MTWFVLTSFYLFECRIWCLLLCHYFLVCGRKKRQTNIHCCTACIIVLIVWSQVLPPWIPLKNKSKYNITFSFRSLVPLPDTPSHLVASLSAVLQAWHKPWCMFLIGRIYLTYPSVKEPIKTWRNGGPSQKEKRKKMLLCWVIALLLFWL